MTGQFICRQNSAPTVCSETKHMPSKVGCTLEAEFSPSRSMNLQNSFLIAGNVAVLVLIEYLSVFSGTNVPRITLHYCCRYSGLDLS